MTQKADKFNKNNASEANTKPDIDTAMPNLYWN